MDRQAWFAVTLCALGLAAWYLYTASHQPARPIAQLTPAPAAVVSPRPSFSATPAPLVRPSPSPAEAAASFAEKIETLKNGDVELRLTNRGGAICEAVLLNHFADQNQNVILNGRDRTPIGALVTEPNVPLAEFTSVPQTDGSVQFERNTPERVNIRKKFFFVPTDEKKDNFVSEMDVEFQNDGATPYNNPGYFLTLGAAMPIHQRDLTTYTRLVWCIDGKAKGTDVNWFAAQNYPFIGVQKRAAQDFFEEKFPAAEWAGMTNQFFTTLLVPLNAKADQVWGARFEIPQPNAAPSLLGIRGAMAMPGFKLDPGKSATMRFEVYTGPKLYHRLAKLEHDEAEIMNFGLWKLVSQALLNFMNLLHGWFGNYAVAIIVLTAVVKGVLWPLQNKANKSMRRMSLLAPKMQALKEKYKDDPTRMQQETMKLYKEHGVNPVGGCLPMMIQIPIFFGLFSMLGQAVELRNAKFLWVHDLSQPDTIGHLFGFPINILPLIMGATSLWLTHMTPKSGDATQQRVMMFTPLIFLIFCYNFAAALALYYTTQNLFTILQLYQNRKQPMPVLEKVAPTGKKARK